MIVQIISPGSLLSLPRDHLFYIESHNKAKRPQKSYDKESRNLVCSIVELTSIIIMSFWSTMAPLGGPLCENIKSTEVSRKQFSETATPKDKIIGIMHFLANLHQNCSSKFPRDKIAHSGVLKIFFAKTTESTALKFLLSII